MADHTRSLTHDELAHYLNYDPDTGLFRYINRPYKTSPLKMVGSAADKHNDAGYIFISLNGKRWLAHRLAWLYMTGRHPERLIDHINGIRDDNRWSNLRQANRSQNSQNVKGPRRDGSSGFLGVKFDMNRGNYIAQLILNGRTVYSGRHATAELASAAYLDAKRRLHPYNTL